MEDIIKEVFSYNSLQSFVFASIIFFAQYISQNEKVVASQFFIAIGTFVVNYWLSWIKERKGRAVGKEIGKQELKEDLQKELNIPKEVLNKVD